MSEAMHVGSGKVRELYALDDERLLLVASDRISTFDVVLPTEIPDKGRVLTGLSGYWFARTPHVVANHLLALRDDGRSTECKRLEMLPIECVVRGYLSGSGWKDYQATGAVCGHRLPDGLVESQQLPAPDLHAGDEGRDRATTRTSIAPQRSSSSARTATTRPRRPHSRSTSSSRSTHASAASSSPTRSSSSGSTRRERSSSATRRSRPTRRASGRPTSTGPARPPPSFDKQFVRDYCESLGWDKTYPGPELPDDVVEGTRARYVEAFERLTGLSFDAYLADSSDRARMRATVLVRPKPGILDPQGQAVESSLLHLGFEVGDARVGRLVDVELDDRRPGRGAGPARAHVRAAPDEPADRELRDRVRRRSE